MDKKGVEEKFKKVKMRGRNEIVQYDYRTKHGELFSCVGKDIASCRTKRDEWISRRQV